MYDPKGTDSKREWIEVYSDSSDNIDITSLKFREGGTSHAIKNSTFISGSSLSSNYYVIADNPEYFLIDNPSFKGSLYDSAFSLNNSGELLEILSSSGVVVDSIAYSSDLGAKNTGNSLQKSDGIFIPAFPTPGQENESVPVNENEADDDSGSSDSNSSNQNNSEGSSHDSSVELSNFKPKVVEVSAGRERFTSTNIPITFKAIFDDKKENKLKLKFDWVFGDGYRKKGEVVEHTYKHPGLYNVVLHAQNAKNYAVSRTIVYVTSPDIIFDYEDPSTDSTGSPKSGSGQVAFILNNSSENELNIGNFKIKAQEYPEFSYTFPADTIISKKAKLYIEEDLIGFSVDSLELHYPNGKEVGRINREEEKLSTAYPVFEEVYKKVLQIQVQLRELSR